MKITIECSRIVKPTYNGYIYIAPSSDHYERLTVFDKVTFNTHTAKIYVFNPPTPSNISIEEGLSKVLAVYRQFAGRLGEDSEGNSVIFLNDQGVRFIEATVDSKLLQNVIPSKPTKEIQSLHPNLYDIEEVAQVQLTRFACGSLVVTFTSHHFVADGQAISNFLTAWGLATRGLATGPVPFHKRDTLFKPREPPIILYDHHKTEYMHMNDNYINTMTNNGNESNREEIEIHKLHFTKDFINKLRAKASVRALKPYSRFETILAHLWRIITKARGLQDYETTEIRISVNGRTRMNLEVPSEYFGNLVLWAFPHSKVRDLINQPLSYAVELIHDAVAKVNDNYFKSFIDFASSDIINKEKLVSSAGMNKRMLSPNLEVHSWLTFPFSDLDFGTGKPYYFLPPYFDIDGLLFFLPSYLGDGGIDVIVSLLNDNLNVFETHCYSME